MDIHSIGFTQHSAKQFFEKLKNAGATRLIDVRLHNVSQLAGFAKRDDLRYFLSELCGTDYTHETELAPTKDLLDGYKKGSMPWSEYEDRFLSLMSARRIEDRIDRELFSGVPVLLCSEHTAERCHRRLVIDYLADQWGGITARHL